MLVYLNVSVPNKCLETGLNVGLSKCVIMALASLEESGESPLDIELGMRHRP